MKTYAKRLVLVILCLTIAVTGVTKTYATYTKDDTFYNGNNILFYDPSFTNATCGGSSASGGGTGVTLNNLKPTDELKTIFQDLLNGGMNAVQAAAVMGNMYQESKYVPDQYQIGVLPADAGYGLAQWTNTSGSPRRDNLFAFATQQHADVATVDLQMKFLLKEYNDTFKSLLAGGDFGKATNINDATKAWMEIFENPYQKPGSSDPAGINERMAAAQKIYGFYSSLAPSTPNGTATATGSGCSSTGGAVAGNIVKTAMNLAWPYEVPEGTINESQATTAYQTAKNKYNPDPQWSDCGGFISTVMRSTGVDPNYPSFGVSVQVQYVESHPDKYKVIQNPSVSDLQPGDILLSNELGHTSMYIGPQSIGDKTYTVAQASLTEGPDDGEIPNLRYSGSETYMISNGAIIARYIGSGV